MKRGRKKNKHLERERFYKTYKRNEEKGKRSPQNEITMEMRERNAVK